MKTAAAAGIVVFAAVLAATAIFGVRVARHFTGARVELGEFKRTQIEPATRARLESLDSRVFVTYFATPREDMPSHMRSVERDVEALLTAMRDASNGKLDFSIVPMRTIPKDLTLEQRAADPKITKAEDLERYASNRRISPVRVRSVTRDSYSEQTVWSGISIAYKTNRPAVINGIEPEHLPRLQALVMGHLDQMDHPRKPIVAFATPSAASSPPGVKAQYSAALAEVKKRVETVEAHERPQPTPRKVIQVDLNAGAPIPREADYLIWIDPVTFTPSRLRELQLFLESGRGAVIAGGEQVAEFGAIGAEPAVAFKPSGYDAEPLLSNFGIRPVRGLVLDSDCAELMAGTEKIAAPFMHRVIGYRQDFRQMRGQPNGTLIFVAPTPMQLDAERLAEGGWSADQLATTSDKTWIAEATPGFVALKSLTPDKGEPLAMQPVMVGLRNRDPWMGQLVFSGTGTVFQDGNYDRKDTAHWRLLKSLLDTLGSDERLVQAKIGIRRPAPVPELVGSQRVLWRSICVLLLPAGLLVFALRRGAFHAHGGAAPRQGRWRLAGLAAAGVAAVVLLTWGAKKADARADLTQQNVNKLAAESAAIAARAGGDPIRVEVIFSSQDRLPPVLRPYVGDVLERLSQIRRAGANLEITRVEPDELAADRRAEIEKSGILPVKISTREEEATVVRNIYSAIRMERAGRREILRFGEPGSFESLEFKIIFALWRLTNGRSPHVVFVSDVPRLTPAEDWDMQQLGLNPPKGNDVYAVARAVLRDFGFRVSHVNPRVLNVPKPQTEPRPPGSETQPAPMMEIKPKIPADADLVIWFQPRRDCCAMMEEMVRYLHAGGRVALFAQHFVMQSRQYPGASFKMVYWPQPQFPDIDELYYPEIGIKPTRQVLFDDLKTRIELESQVHRGAQKELKPMESALPFLVRASAANFAKDSLITKDLGDQAFLYASFLEWDAARLAELGITAKPIIKASDRAWTYDWHGYWLPDSYLSWPPKSSVVDGRPTGEPRMLPNATLAALFEGTFPLPAAPLTIQPPQNGSESQPKPVIKKNPDDPGKPAKFLFVACSEPFKNYRILNQEFRADQMLTNVAAALALDENLASVAVRRPVARGFGLVDPDATVFWRAAVQASPALLLGFAIVWILARRGRPAKAA